MIKWQILVRWPDGTLELNPHVQENYDEAMEQASRIWIIEDDCAIRLYYLKWDLSKRNDIPELWDVPVMYLEERKDEKASNES